MEKMSECAGGCDPVGGKVCGGEFISLIMIYSLVISGHILFIIFLARFAAVTGRLTAPSASSARRAAPGCGARDGASPPGCSSSR